MDTPEICWQFFIERVRPKSCLFVSYVLHSSNHDCIIVKHCRFAKISILCCVFHLSETNLEFEQGSSLVLLTVCNMIGEYTFTLSHTPDANAMKYGIYCRFHSWPEEALISVAGRFLSDVPDLQEGLRESISKHMAFVHQSVSTASHK